ncbi:MAG TPA: hypothetical protein VND93_14750, partial [Myxococcales bacterium]|nr:hypothetical protein [Myxococcales bacterium]
PRLIPEGSQDGNSTSQAQGSSAQAPRPQRTRGGERPPENVDQWASSVPWWGWTLVGLGAGLVVGGATYAIVQANRPISGTVVVRW